MSNFGFVYILVNRYMRTTSERPLFKVGCTERSPHQRAAELSSGSGIPAPFEVLCYAEFKEFQAVERKMHEWLSEYRVSDNREFFVGALGFAVRLLYWNRARLSFSIPEPDPELDGVWRLYGVTQAEECNSLADTCDPWAKPEPPTPEEAVAKVVSDAQAAASAEQAQGQSKEPS